MLQNFHPLLLLFILLSPLSTWSLANNHDISTEDEIEIIRDPGAALHGKFAYSGGMGHFSNEEKNISLAINSAMNQTDGQSHHSGPDSFGNYGKQSNIITFPPFVGDVTLGVAGPIAIIARILPQLNMTTIAASKSALKPFFLRIAFRYPEVEIN